MGGLDSREITFLISDDSVYPLGIAWSAAAAGVTGQEHLLLLAPWVLKT